MKIQIQYSLQSTQPEDDFVVVWFSVFSRNQPPRERLDRSDWRCSRRNRL